MNGEKSIPVIDLFAGPGGLGEGFSSFSCKGKDRFKIALSVEKDPHAHATLTLRAFYRQFTKGKVPAEYYAYVRGEISSEDLFDAFPKQADAAKKEALCLTLGEDENDDVVRGLISERVKGDGKWVMIGGPPCQAYSLAGRSRMLGAIERMDDESEEDYLKRRDGEFEQDHRHQLYREYLKIIAHAWPHVFVMENVKGLLSSRLNGELIFPNILEDLRNPSQIFESADKTYKYRIYSLSTRAGKQAETSETKDLPGFTKEFAPKDYVIKSEEYGIPQARHRVILLGIRDDIDIETDNIPLLKPGKVRTVQDVISDLPRLTSGVSRGGDIVTYDILSSVVKTEWWAELSGDPSMKKVLRHMNSRIKKLPKRENRGSRFVAHQAEPETKEWFYDSNLKGACNHETRSHIESDLARYFFCASFAHVNGRAPQLKDFPPSLLPAHKNVQEAQLRSYLRQDVKQIDWDRKHVSENQIGLTFHCEEETREIIFPLNGADNFDNYSDKTLEDIVGNNLANQIRKEEKGSVSISRNNAFSDRFRVQLRDQPATTITSHISKDGHYYIHYDPSQCRSLTVREAARIQTFPDNYFFEGGRTQQFHQVGNAVPPFLARQIAEVVFKIIEGSDG